MRGIARVRLARGTPWWMALPWLAVAGAAARRQRLLAGGLLVLAAGSTSFFRDPSRHPDDALGLVAAADGLVQSVEPTTTGGWHISTYLNLLNVHVTRMPCEALVTRQEHRPGTHKMAFRHESETNERLVWQLQTAHGPVEMVQYAGAAVRRIIPYVEAGATLARGERTALIRFGSRVDLVLPSGLQPSVRPGERTRAGTTVVAVPTAAATVRR